jgi:DNA-binding MarR family transcriptional regulator
MRPHPPGCGTLCLTRTDELRRILAMARSAKRRSSIPDLTDQVLVALRRIIRANDIRSRQLAKQTGLTTAQLVVLRTIARLGEVTTRTISLEVSLSPATVTTIMDRLSERGFVERYRSPSDRRVVYTRLTPKGSATLSAAPVLLQELFTERFRELPVPARETIVQTLEQVARMMDADQIDPTALFAEVGGATALSTD